MKTISENTISDAVRELCIEAATKLDEDVKAAIKNAAETEESPLGRDVLKQIVDNYELAEEKGAPMCQDTGIAVFFVELGRDIKLEGSLEEGINQGVRRGYEDGYLRKSVCDPFSRKNTGDNTPAIIHTTVVEGDTLKIKFAPKGAGSENMSQLRMLKPAQGVEGVKDFVYEAVKTAGGNPCPPIVLGIGIGGNFEKSAILSKKALLRKIGSKNSDPELAALEAELLIGVNKLGIGPMGFGGIKTALAIHVESAPCHIASLPVAINVQCHADRHKEVEL